jgi:poly(3-hydroxybutyrate) depolymerase
VCRAVFSVPSDARVHDSHPRTRSFMRVRRLLLLLVCTTSLVAARATAQEDLAFSTPGPCEEGSLAGGARSLICVPSERWNGHLVVLAHGYVSPLLPPAFTDLALPDGARLPDLVQRLGFAFATTTYRRNGLAILEGVEDVVELVKTFRAGRQGPPDKVYLAGMSHGGLVAVLATEQYPELFTATLSACGPVGNFPFQVNFVGDFRILFDVYFPGILPGSPVDIPAVVQANWERRYVPAIEAALAQHPARARELLKVAGVPYDVRDPSTIVQSTTGLLWHNVFGANDARARLGGNPYDNRLRWYAGSSNDALLNLRVARVDADLPALLALRAYSPIGDVRVPIVSLHTTGDELAPFAHELIYAAKARPTGRGRVLPLPIVRYGHCAFTTSEWLTGFALMLGAGTAADAPQTAVAAGRLTPSPDTDWR